MHNRITHCVIHFEHFCCYIFLLLFILISLFRFSLQKKKKSVTQKTVCHGKSTSAKRSVRAKMPIAATPLRQVMSKSIQRAIREHDRYTKSPLDLRMSPVVRRSCMENRSPSKRYTNKFTKTTDEIFTPETIVTNRKRRSIELRSGSILETVYETAKATDIADECENSNDADNLRESCAKDKALATSRSNEAVNANDAAANFPITETPVLAAQLNANNTNDNDDGHENGDVWYTPCENIPIREIDKPEVIERYRY